MTQVISVTEGVVEPERISPEGLEVANSYLVTNNLRMTAQDLNLPTEMVADQLRDPLVQKYMTAVYMDTGYRNRFTLGSALDRIIATKMEEMEEAEISSSKDIAELLLMAHKMRMDELKLEMEKLKLENAANPKGVPVGNTINIQDNSLGGSNYNKLLENLLTKKGT
jgi:hypothetical protein